MTKTYPPQKSKVSVYFTDGQVKKFTMSASNAIVHHLMKEAAATGTIIMRNDTDKKSICIPLAQVQYVEVDTIEQDQPVTPEDNPK